MHPGDEATPSGTYTEFMKKMEMVILSRRTRGITEWKFQAGYKEIWFPQEGSQKKDRRQLSVILR